MLMNCSTACSARNYNMVCRLTGFQMHHEVIFLVYLVRLNELFSSN
ncbi:LOW QUALITY PROTEIN: hypothetical protein TorRG33x02_053830 [Trema orientale]|uniref:Uncharacterized protein n=1 Tax=Trema orientale TaxID=63057 RepID=A0A2P5FLT9_TREOI|nr:LOW QUALITY PROTEIN: hypothetical protein TorRG33x02_053830 [Trema orientale]